MKSLARLVRIIRLQKLMKLFRVFKLVQKSDAAMKKVSESFKIGIGFQRLVFFTLIFFLTVHIFACLWLIVANMYDEEYKGTWLEEFKAEFEESKQ